MEYYSTAWIIDAFKKEDKKALLYVYKTYFPQVRHYIMENSGNELDADDVFQDAVVLIYIKIRNNTLYLSSSFGTYLNGVVRYFWVKELERKRRYFGHPLHTENHPTYEDNFIEEYSLLEKRKLIMQHFNELNGECKKIIELNILETPLSRITAIMGYSSDQYTMNRRTLCKERLITAIWNNPRYKELKNEAFSQDSKIPRW